MKEENRSGQMFWRAPRRVKCVDVFFMLRVERLCWGGLSTLIRDHLAGGASRLAALLLPYATFDGSFCARASVAFDATITTTSARRRTAECRVARGTAAG